MIWGLGGTPDEKRSRNAGVRPMEHPAETVSADVDDPIVEAFYSGNTPINEEISNPTEQSKEKFINFYHELFSKIERINSGELSPLTLVDLAKDKRYFARSWRHVYSESFRSLVLHAASIGRIGRDNVEKLLAFCSDTFVVSGMQQLRNMGSRISSRIESDQIRAEKSWNSEVVRPTLKINKKTGYEYLEQPEIINAGLNGDGSAFAIIERFFGNEQSALNPYYVAYLKVINNLHKRRVNNTSESVPFPKKEKYSFIFHFGEYAKKVFITFQDLESFESFYAVIEDQIKIKDIQELSQRESNLRLTHDLKTTQELLVLGGKIGELMTKSGFKAFTPSDDQIERGFSGEERIQDDAVQRAIEDPDDMTAADMAFHFAGITELSIKRLKRDKRFLCFGTRVKERIIFLIQDGQVRGVADIAAHFMVDGSALIPEVEEVLSDAAKYDGSAKAYYPNELIYQSFEELNKQNEIDKMDFVSTKINLDEKKEYFDKRNKLKRVGLSLRERVNGIFSAPKTDEMSERYERGRKVVDQQVGGLFNFFSSKESVGKYASKAISIPSFLHFMSLIATKNAYGQFLDKKTFKNENGETKAQLQTVESILPLDVHDFVLNYKRAQFEDEFDSQMFEKLWTSFLLLGEGRDKVKNFVSSVTGSALMAGRFRKYISGIGRTTAQGVTDLSTDALLTSMLIDPKGSRNKYRKKDALYTKEFCTALNDANKEGVAICDAVDGFVNIVFSWLKKNPHDNRAEGLPINSQEELTKILDNLIAIFEDAMKYYDFNQHKEHEAA